MGEKERGRGMSFSISRRLPKQVNFTLLDGAKKVEIIHQATYSHVKSRGPKSPPSHHFLPQVKQETRPFSADNFFCILYPPISFNPRVCSTTTHLVTTRFKLLLLRTLLNQLWSSSFFQHDNVKKLGGILGRHPFSITAPCPPAHTSNWRPSLKSICLTATMYRYLPPLYSRTLLDVLFTFTERAHLLESPLPPSVIASFPQPSLSPIGSPLPSPKLPSQPSR